MSSCFTASAGLMPADFPAPENLCPCFLTKCSAFLCLVSGPYSQARFGGDEIISIHNQHQWAEENPHGVIQSRHQQQFSDNVWAGIVGDCLAGPHVLPHRLTGSHYQDFH
jgi:hypothetical protein